MAERTAPRPGDAEPGAAVWDWARDVRIRRHPVVRVCVALLCRQQRQQRRERVHRKGRLREDEVLSLHVERVTETMAADHRAIAGDDVYPQVEQLERIVNGIVT